MHVAQGRPDERRRRFGRAARVGAQVGGAGEGLAVIGPAVFDVHLIFPLVIASPNEGSALRLSRSNGVESQSPSNDMANLFSPRGLPLHRSGRTLISWHTCSIH
jgi:hypothetical protein